MLNPDEIIDSGFAALKSAQPSQTPADLAIMVRRQARKAKVTSAAIGSVGCLSIGAVFLVAMRPASAIAALRESARLSAAQPVVHLRIVNQDTSTAPQERPAPHTPTLDIWKFRDRYIRKQGHLICEQFKTGRILSYDDRFPFGFDSTYDAKNDHFWSFDGSIGVEIDRRNQLAPSVKTVQAHGGEYTAYEWRFKNSMATTDERIYVDPQSKLIRYAEGDRRGSDGDTNHGLVEVEYPDASAVEHGAPQFPKGLKFRTSDELIKSFYQAMSLPEQTKSIAGIRNSLYGVILYPDQGEGLRVDVVTRGGAGPDFGSGYEPQVVGGPLLRDKMADLAGPFGTSGGAKHGREQLIHWVKYIRNESLDLLSRAPSQITVRVPVWRLSPKTIDRGGKPVHVHEFVGYVTFTTSRLFYCLSDAVINWYDVGRYRQ